MERHRNTEITLAHETLQDSTRSGGSPRARLERADARATGRVKTHHHKHNVRQRYEVLETLGAGTYGKVNRAVKRQCGQTVAIKSIRKVKLKDDLDRAHIQREIEITASLLHPNIIRLYEVFESRERIVMVMEYASRGELYEYIQEKARLSEEEAKHFFRQITAAVQHCHRNGVVHRDLKLENILLDKDLNVKLADFGLSNHYMRGHFLDTFCGSPLYASPEIINGHPYQGPEVDCWSLGVLLFALVYGSMPFDGASYTILKEQISEGQYKTPDFQSDACSLIRWMLTVRVEDRATVEDIANHWWLNAEFPVTMCDSKSNVPNHPDTKNHMEITFINPYNTKNYVALPLPLESPYHNQLTKLPKKGILKNLYDHVEKTSPQCTQRSESVGSGQTSIDRTVEIKAADIQRKGILKCNRKFSDVPLTTITPTWPHSVSSKHCMGLEFEGGEQQEMELEIKISLWKTQEPETMGLQFSSK